MTNTGYRQYLYFGDEDSYGAAATVDQPIGLVQTVSPTEKNNLIKVRTIGGTRDYSNIVPGKFEISGSFDYLLQGGAFLRQGMSEDSGSTATVDLGPRFHTGANSYVHVMGSALSPASDSFPSFTLEFTDYEDSGDDADTANLKRTFTGCRVNQLTISGDVDNPVKVNVDWMAQGVTVSTGAPSSVSAYSADPYVFYQGGVYATSGAITAHTSIDDTSNICEVNSFDFGVNNNLEATWYVCGTTATTQTLRGLKHLLPKGRDYTSSLGLHFKNKKQYQRFLGAASATESQGTLTEYYVVIDLARSGSPASSPQVNTDDWLRIVMSGVKFGDINIAGAPEDIVSQNITLEVEAAKIYVVDTDASYK